jgi:hypothetical protein
MPSVDELTLKVGKAYDTEKMKFSKYASFQLDHSTLANNYYLAAVNIKTEFPELESLVEVPEITQKVFSLFLLLTLQ